MQKSGAPQQRFHQARSTAAAACLCVVFILFPSGGNLQGAASSEAGARGDERGEGGEATRAAAVDGEAGWVREPLRDEETSAAHHILHVAHAPVALERTWGAVRTHGRTRRQCLTTATRVCDCLVWLILLARAPVKVPQQQPEEQRKKWHT